MIIPEHCSIFVFKVGSIGDSIVAIPALKKIKDQYKGEFHLITNKPSNGVLSSWEVFKLTGLFKDFFEFDYSLKSILKLRRFIKREKKHKVIFYFSDLSSFRRNFRNYLFFKAIGFSEVFGWKECVGSYIKRDSKGQLTEVEPEYKRLEGIVDKYIDKKYIFDVDYDFIKFNNLFIRDTLEKYKFLDDAYFVIGLGGKSDIQRWNIDSYINVLKELNKDITLVALGGNNEYDDVEKIKVLLPELKILNFCGKTSLHESAFILSKALFYFGNDTGTSHLAGIVKTKSIVITSGRDNIGRWAPYGNIHTIIRKRTECEGCLLFSSSGCKHNLSCMNEIDSNHVKKIIINELSNY